MPTVTPAFVVKFGQPIYLGLATVGKFDGKSPSLACGTTGGKILLHSPHESSSSGSDSQLPSVRFLNFNKKITALTSGSLATNKSASEPDHLFVGTESNLLAYDVERNSDLFFRDTADGVNALVIGKVGNSAKPLVVAGGNCSILGFDGEGNESFWTVTGDNISALTFCDIDNDGLQELVVGSEDFEIRVFKNEEVVGELTEADKVTLLTPTLSNRFAYGLANGTVGVYIGSKTRLWRVKTKNTVTAIGVYDLDSDGVPEVVSGWNNGMLNVRNCENGETVYKESMGSTVSSLLKSDYRLDGKEELMVCLESGEVRGYLPADGELFAMNEQGVELAKEGDQKAIEELQAQKLELNNEMRQVEKNLLAMKDTQTAVASGGLPGNTALNYSLYADEQGACVSLKIEVSVDVSIANIIAIDLEGGILDGSEVLAVTPPSTAGKSATLPLRPTKNQGCVLRVQTHVAPRSFSSQLHVFEADVTIPRFCSFKKIEDPDVYSQPNSQISLRLNESASRIADWIASGFLLPTPIKITGDKLKVCFVSVCSPPSKTADVGITKIEQPAQRPLHVLASRIVDDDTNKGNLRVRIRCDDLDLAADLIQDMAKFFKLTELESEADFPDEFQKFEEITKRVEEFNGTRIRLAADMADDSQRVKALVVRAEDSRLMVDMSSMRRAYTELFALNNSLVMGYNARAGNHEGLLAALKEVNLMIQRSANVRVGKAKTSIIADCRAAVKANNMSSLYRIMRYGNDQTASSSGK